MIKIRKKRESREGRQDCGGMCQGSVKMCVCGVGEVTLYLHTMCIFIWEVNAHDLVSPLVPIKRTVVKGVIKGALLRLGNVSRACMQELAYPKLDC